MRMDTCNRLFTPMRHATLHGHEVALVPLHRQRTQADQPAQTNTSRTYSTLRGRDLLQSLLTNWWCIFAGALATHGTCFMYARPAPKKQTASKGTACYTKEWEAWTAWRWSLPLDEVVDIKQIMPHKGLVQDLFKDTVHCVVDALLPGAESAS